MNAPVSLNVGFFGVGVFGVRGRARGRYRHAGWRPFGGRYALGVGGGAGIAGRRWSLHVEGFEVGSGTAVLKPRMRCDVTT